MMHSDRAFKAATKMLIYAFAALVGLVAFGWVASQIGPIIWSMSGVLFALFVAFAVFVLYFFRDPDPIVPSQTNAIVAPAHGKVDVIDETAELEFMGGPCRRISIFLSVFDVHVQNAPVHAKVVHTQHKPGQFLNAMRTDSASRNENVLIGFQPLLRPPEDKVAVRLIAGLIARRIVPWVTAGDVVERSDRIGLIQFGSRVELYLPMSTQIKIMEGDHVMGGQTIVAVFPQPEAGEAKTAAAKPEPAKPAIRVPIAPAQPAVDAVKK